MKLNGSYNYNETKKVWEINGARIGWCNFAGLEQKGPDGTKFNDFGKRNFTLFFDDDLAPLADILKAEGFNVKWPNVEPDEGKDPAEYTYSPHLKINVNMDSKWPPIVKVKVGDTITDLTGDEVRAIDGLTIEAVNMDIRGYEYKPGKKSAYLNAIYITAEPGDRF